MEMLHEVFPFLIGLVLPPVVLLLSRLSRSMHLTLLSSFVLAFLVGACISFFAGELAGSLADSIIALIIDSSLVYTASQVSYRLWWKPFLFERLSQQLAKSRLS